MTYETVEDLIAPLYSHPTTIPLPDVPEGECVWLCTRCQSILGKGKVPLYACINNIQVVKVPPVLSVLNTMEQRLISSTSLYEAYSTSIRSKSIGWPKYKFPC